MSRTPTNSNELQHLLLRKEATAMNPLVQRHIQAQINLCRHAEDTRQWRLKNKLKRNICALYPLRHMSSRELRAHLTHLIHPTKRNS